MIDGPLLMFITLVPFPTALLAEHVVTRADASRPPLSPASVGLFRAPAPPESSFDTSWGRPVACGGLSGRL